MKNVIGYALVMIVLLVAGEGFRRASLVEAQLADAEERLITIGAPANSDGAIEASAAALVRVPLAGTRLAGEVRRQRASEAYWRGDYTGVGAPASSDPAQQADSAADAAAADPSLQLLAANAAFRTAVRDQRTPAALARSLDEVLKRYVTVLETVPEDGSSSGSTDADANAGADAAFNYEFVARLRSALAGGRTAAPAPRRGTIQGEKGDPPAGTRPADFNVIVPLRPDERQEQTDPGAGAQFKRQG